MDILWVTISTVQFWWLRRRHSSIMLRSKSGERPLVGSSRISKRGFASSSHGDGNTLFLAAGQLGDKRLFTPLQIDSLNGVGHGGGDLGAGRIVGNAQLAV